MPKGVPKYDGAFKKQIVEEMREKGLSYREIARQYEMRGAHSVADWERIYLEEGLDGLFIERRGRGSKGWPPKKLKLEVEEDLLAEVQRLRAENAYCALPGFVDSKNEEKTERNAGYLVVSHSGGGMLRQGTRKGIRRTPANRGMRAHRIVKSLDISEDVCHGLCP